MLMMFFVFVLTPVPEGASMETILGLDDIIDLRGGQHAEELVVIGLLDVLQLNLIDIALLHALLTLGLIDGLDLALLLDLTLDGALLLVHLTKQREELGGLFRRETGLLGDKLLHLRLELLRGELLRLVSKGRYTQEKHYTQGKQQSLHLSLLYSSDKQA